MIIFKNGNTREKKALNLSMKMKDPLFMLQFVGMCDIYSVFGEGVNILQKVNALPHEKSDSLNEKVIFVLNAKNTTLDSHIRCYTGSFKKCFWP